MGTTLPRQALSKGFSGKYFLPKNNAGLLV
jgi:hypothetical protein